MPSHNYLGLYYYDRKEYAKARKELDIVLKQPNSPYAEEALTRVADIQERYKEYPEAFVSYQKLERLAQRKESRQNARLGMLRMAVELGDNKAVIDVSKKLLDDATLSPEHIRTARAARAESFLASTTRHKPPPNGKNWQKTRVPKSVPSRPIFWRNITSIKATIPKPKLS